MPHSEGTFKGTNGIDLYYQSWQPSTTPKATIGIIHGLGSHSGWFQGIAENLASQGYAAYNLDLRGHGRSPGQRAYINHWSEFRGDIDRFQQLMADQHPDIPCFALGHSLGAIILLDVALRDRQALSGLILMAPSLNPSGVPAWRLAAGQILSWVYPRFSLDTGIPQNAGSRDPNVITAYTQDPLRHRRGTARLVSEFLKTIRWIDTNLAQLQIPVLVLHGGNDIVTPPANSHELFEKLAIVDKEYREYPDAYHDLHNDLDMPQVIVDISNWLDRHIDGDLHVCRLSGRLISIS
ncbi:MULTISPECIES: alpha/beta hydrolase [unclassified Leptolyngbya]|uniref:alpha/beta hydrolase n=1 Tax=unclassified Leptolyngbya TaxID=2650499 RepID=UPI001689873D|nr:MULTISPECIES: alpha/beta hydrolase [unclassified Leptolyngbya]MBD1910492.1 lysophospholipase [Leptolyngbya sp. FACHB-8]MBD2153659.1 lysophospholipase [Leptolyngbya sp. FACHB-16]